MLELPKFNLSQVYKQRDKLVSQVLTPYVGHPVDLDEFARKLQRGLPGKITFDPVYESVRHLAGQTLTLSMAVRLAWRLAGNIPTLKAGRSVKPWTAQFADEWVPLQILRIERGRDHYNRIGYHATCRVLAGTSATMKVDHFWNVRAVGMIGRKLGFSSSHGTYPFKGARNMTNLRFVGLVESAKSQGRPKFWHIDCPGSMVKWNRDNVLKLRLRVKCTCPFNYHHDCTQCAVGYDQCAGGTHHRTYTIGHCANCQTDNSVFDPEDILPHCVPCMRRQRMQVKEK